MAIDEIVHFTIIYLYVAPVVVSLAFSAWWIWDEAKARQKYHSSRIKRILWCFTPLFNLLYAGMSIIITMDNLMWKFFPEVCKMSNKIWAKFFNKISRL